MIVLLSDSLHWRRYLRTFEVSVTSKQSIRRDIPEDLEIFFLFGLVIIRIVISTFNVFENR